MVFNVKYSNIFSVLVLKLNFCKLFLQVFNVHNNSFLMDASELDPETDYLVQVRSKACDYDGEWSEWSSVMQLKNNAKEASNMFLLLKFALLMCLVVGALMFLYIPVKRIMIETYFHVPSPAPFFQPLFTDYKGSLTNWLASEGTLMSIHKIEEPQTADTLIIEDNTIQEDQHLCATRNTQLQEQSPYVCHSVMDWLSPVTTIGSCSTPRFRFEGNVLSSTYNTTATSKGDSGCEDLMNSPISPLPESPLLPKVPL